MVSPGGPTPPWQSRAEQIPHGYRAGPAQDTGGKKAWGGKKRRAEHSDAVLPSACWVSSLPVSQMSRYSWRVRPAIHATDYPRWPLGHLLNQPSPLLVSRLAPNRHAGLAPCELQIFFHAMSCVMPIFIVVLYPTHDASHHLSLYSVESLQLRCCKRSC